MKYAENRLPLIEDDLEIIRGYTVTGQETLSCSSMLNEREQRKEV
ncbi:unnamed protein product [Brassica oleracea var. botrytis]